MTRTSNPCIENLRYTESFTLLRRGGILLSKETTRSVRFLSSEAIFILFAISFDYFLCKNGHANTYSFDTIISSKQDIGKIHDNFF